MSVWVVIWGTVASLMDWMLLTGEVYETGTSGQAVTFIGYGAATVVMATRYSGRFLAPDAERVQMDPKALISSEAPMSRARASKARFTIPLPLTNDRCAPR